MQRHYHSSSAPEPGFPSDTTMFQTTGPIHESGPEINMPPTLSLQRARPCIPQKKTHVDEIFRLKKELEEVARARDEAMQMRDMMEEDLLTIQDDIQEKDKELRLVSEEMRAWREKAKNLSNQDTEDPSNQQTDTYTTRTSMANTEAKMEQIQLRQQIEHLTTALAEKDALLVQSSILEARQSFEHEMRQKEEHWRSSLTEEQRLRQTAEADLLVTKDHYDSRLKDVEQRANTMIEEEKKRTHDSESALNEQINRMVIDSTSHPKKEDIAQYEATIHEQRQRCDQFRRSSERLTMQLKQAMEAKKDLERSDQEMRLRVEDLKSQITSLQLQPRDYRMPGSWNNAQTHFGKGSQR